MPNATTIRVFVFGTCKKGFPLHGALSRGRFLGLCRTREQFPMIVAGPWYAPMMFDEPGVGMQVSGELYELDEASLRHLDAVESVGIPGNCRKQIDVEPVDGGAPLSAFVYMKARELANPMHTGYLESYHDRRFVPQWERGASARGK